MNILLLLFALTAAAAALGRAGELMMLSWSQHEPKLALSSASHSTHSGGGGLILLHNRYVLERAIQVSSHPTWELEARNAFDLLPFWKQQQPAFSTSLNDRYALDDRLGAGGCGEVWYARDILNDNKLLVLKRIFLDKLPSGLREEYFGQALGKREGNQLFTRFIESFYRTSSLTLAKELWLVFEHEGASLHSLLYDADSHGGNGLVRRSAFWKKLRETRRGGAYMRREIAKQLVLALQRLAKLGIVHRDVKPSNVLISFERQSVRLGDFGSALDFKAYFDLGLFGKSGLTRGEHSSRYEPPEFSSLGETEVGLPFEGFAPSFDAWSLGVLLLEMLLGTDRVFELSSAQQRRLLRTHGGGSGDVYAALREFGLDDLPRFNASIKRLDDVYHRGFFDDEDEWSEISHNELDFVFQLLRLDPSQRMSMDDALRHAYFAQTTPPPPRPPPRPQSQEKMSSLPLGSKPHAIEFTCNTCQRKFSTYEGCRAHALARRHHHPLGRKHPGINCAASLAINTSSNLCDAHTLLGDDTAAATDMWCGNRGKRTYSEDFFLASHSMRVFAVADGHLGDGAARFVTKELVRRVESNAGSADLHAVFDQVNQAFLAQRPNDTSGAAVTLAVVREKELVVANVGDVRAILCCDAQNQGIRLTQEHLAATEEERINALPGGFVRFENGRMRVQGALALSRSFGDRALRPYVISEPSVRVFNLTKHARFLVLATDGLTDAISDEDIVLLCQMELEKSERVMLATTTIQETTPLLLPWYTRAARSLIHEAQARDLSSDNLGVAVIPIR